ncbi:MAG: hypothetical protein ACRC8S_09905 [Fimbriiglobus sp.]
MFGFGTTSARKAFPPQDRGRVAGLDLTATRIVGLSSESGRQRPLAFQGHDVLPMMLHLEARQPVVGNMAVAVARKSPHLVCAEFLPQIGQPRHWQHGRAKLTPEAAVQCVFEAIQPDLAAEVGSLEIAIPSYLSPKQVKTISNLAHQAKLPGCAFVSAPVAVVAHRASLIAPAPVNTPALVMAGDGSRADWIVPMPRTADGPAAVVVIDADDFALTASIVVVEPGSVNLAISGAWPRASYRLWKDRLLDALADQCVRRCRRDPRDSAEAEQILYDQLEPAMDRVRSGYPASVQVRSSHWYQDLIHTPEEFDRFCLALAQPTAEGIATLVEQANLECPPLAIWLTHNAARMPGLAAAIHRTSPESTSVLALPPMAIAEAAAALSARRQLGRLSTEYLDSTIPTEVRSRNAEVGMRK